MMENEFPPAAMGFLRVAAVSPELRVADVRTNTRFIVEAMEQAAASGCRLVVFPELGITGYTCADLFYQALLLQQASGALLELAEAAGRCGVMALVGLPLRVDGRLYNCAALVAGGRVLGIVPKTFLPASNEFYEDRWFNPGDSAPVQAVEIGGATIPFGTDLLFVVEDMADCCIGVEICEDLWSVEPPSGEMARAGATLLLNPSASDEILGKADYRRDLVRQQSARCLAAYIYAGSGPGESTTDLVFPGHSLIAENGVLLAETERFQFKTHMAVADIDLQRLAHERIRSASFGAATSRRSHRIVSAPLPTPHRPPRGGDERESLLRPLSPTPFVPADPAQRARHCREIFAIQSTGLAKRLRHTGLKKVTVALSGGLDSTLALLVIVKSFDILGLDRRGIVAVTMPGFGTTVRTRTNAERLAELLGTSLRRIPIIDSVRQHFKDIGHDERVYDVTYENAQARERTQIVMDIANEINGLQIGTGDLSELALGWCTYNGDQMSMYGVNAGVPKTLVRYLVEWAAEAEFTGEASAVLRDICATPITPELLPLGAQGALEQKTEETIGPYELHDFFLFYTVRYPYTPRKVFFLARLAFGERYTPQQILRWLHVFYKRFFSQQFKRSAMPDGPKVGSVALSPRGDWRMPSDASSALWAAEVEAMQRELAE